MNVFGFRRNFLVALPISLLALTSAANATTITGLGQIASAVTVSATAINFQSSFSPFSVQTGDFTGLTGGTIGSLTGGVMVGHLATPIVDFITFNTPTGNIFFDLTDIVQGAGTTAACFSNTVGNTCTPGVSPFTLTQQQGNVLVGLTFLGQSYKGTSASGESPTIGSFSTQIIVPQSTITGILGVLTAGGSISTSYSAAFNANPVPEPSAASLLFAGVALIAGSRVIRRYRQS